MNETSGGELVIQALARQGIDTVFTLHGGHLDAIFQAALDAGVRLIDTRHEQAAGHAAEGWARVTRRPGVAIVTAGPGVTDVVTAVTNAYLDCIPTLFIGGAAPLSDAEMLPLQGGFDQVDLLRPVTKWAHRITHTHRISDLVAQALRVATCGRPGPVFLEIPIDVLFRRLPEVVSSPDLSTRKQARPAPPSEAVAETVALLRAASRPAILAGGGAWFSGAEAELVKFAETSGIPVFANGKARGMVPDSSATSGGSFATLGALTAAGSGPDTALILGARLGLFTGGRTGRMIPDEARVVQVDIEPEEVGRNRDIHLSVAADCRETLLALLAAAPPESWPDRSAWRGIVREARLAPRAAFAGLAAEPERIHPYRLAHELARMLPPDAIVAGDGGETASWMDMVLDAECGGSWLSHGYLGCLGVGLPFAIAARAAYPQRPVVCITGDGSVGLNFAEFDTMVRHQLPIVTVVNNDQAWGMSKHGQQLMFGHDRTVVTDLGPVRYDLAAAGFGCHAEFVTQLDELRPALERAFASGAPACVNVLTDPDVIAPVTAMMVGRQPVGTASVNLPYYGEREA